MSKRFCKKCKSTDIVEDGYYGGTTYYKCKTCHNLSDKDDFPLFTLFHQITASPEVLAEKSLYAHECCRIPDGITSPFIDIIFWFDDEKGDTWDERFDSAWEKALNATLARLKEVKNE